MENYSIEELNCMVDLHLHLDGAISVKSARELASMQGISLPTSDIELEKLIRVSEDCSDLNEFLEKFALPCSLLQTKEGITKAVQNLLSELKAQGYIYCEIRFAPQLLLEKGLSQDEASLAAIEGSKLSDLPCQFILCCMRGDRNLEENLENIRVAKKYLGKGVCAIDLAGAEGLFETYKFGQLFTYAKELGVPCVIHAGEADGPRSVKDAISFGAKRIGHGVRSLEDEDLIEDLALKRIPLELCPTSNINTAIFKDIKDYPLRKLMEKGLTLTINTDDPAIEGTSLKAEYQKLIDNFDLTQEEVKGFLINAVRASFAEPNIKEKLIEQIKTS